MVRSRSRILLVEDDDPTREGMTALLEHAGYTVRSASVFVDGRRLLAEDPPDLLIADVRLGRYNGLQLVATSSRGVPSIMVTGFPDPALRAEAMKLGAHYITKPIAPEEFLSLVESTIVSARRRQSRGSTRRWERKSVLGQVSAEVEHAQARLVDVSYGGVKFEIRPPDQTVPESFLLRLSNLALQADLVWKSMLNEDVWVCGAAVWPEESSARQWFGLVDTVY